ncbi:MAG: hypothetical protein ACOX60_06185 [Massiliimalia sp.]|jgi:hypothetical protein
MSEKGNVVMSYKHKGVQIEICDDYCRDVTPEQVDQILKGIAQDLGHHYVKNHKKLPKAQAG